MIRKFFAIIQIGFGLFSLGFYSYIEKNGAWFGNPPSLHMPGIPKLTELELGFWILLAILIAIDGLVALFSKK